jgi:hypothetical protein
MDITYIKAVFGALRSTVTKPLFKIDSGVILQIAGITDLPEYFYADFANSEKGTATRVLGHDGEATIPDALLKTGLPIFCWVYVVNETTGRTVYSVKIPVKQRSNVEDPQPTPEQADIITQAINALNSAGDSASQSASEAQTYAERAETASESAQASETSATQSAESASQSAQDAAQSATDASGAEARARRYAQDANVDADRAEMAAHTAGFFWLEVDANDDLIFIRTDNAPVNIYADENDDLIVEAH